MGTYLNIAADSVYSSFDRAVHVKPLTVHTRLPVFWALDFNIDPMCSIVAQRRGDEIHVLDEIQLHRASTEDACTEFINRYGAHASGVSIYGDASGLTMQTTSGVSDYKIIQAVFKREGLEEVNFRVRRSNPAVRGRIGLVNAKLKSAGGEVAIYIDPKCKELIKDMEEVAYQKDSLSIDKMTDHRRTHMSDALGYLVYQEMEVNNTVGPQGQRLI